MEGYLCGIVQTVICTVLYRTVFVSAINKYGYMGPYDICDPVLRWHSIPVLPYGHIRSPDYPEPTHQSYNCEVTVQVERESWLGIYTGSFSILPGGECLDSDELKVSSSIPGPVKHFCGEQEGLLYSKYMPSAGNYVHLSFIISRDQNGEGSFFELHYIIAKAIFNGTNSSRKVEASTIGHIVSHSEFTDQSGYGYGTNIDSSLTLTGIALGTTIELDIIYFDIYQYDDIFLPCADYLEISGADRPLPDEPLPKLCGWKNANDSIVKTIVTKSEELTFTFHTQGSNKANKGFLIRYTLLPVYGEETTAYYTPYTTVTVQDKGSANNTELKSRVASVKLPGKISIQPSRATTKTMVVNATASSAPTHRKVRLPVTQKHGAYIVELSVGIGVLLIVLIVVIIVVALFRRTRTTNLDGCYSDHIFSVRSVSPMYNSTGAFRYVDDENIYYNDVEVFERHCNVQPIACIEENFYHEVEPPTCVLDEPSTADTEYTEYEICGNVQRMETVDEVRINEHPDDNNPSSSPVVAEVLSPEATQEMTDNDLYGS